MAQDNDTQDDNEDISDSEPSTTYEMGKIYVEGMSEDEEESDSDEEKSEYSEYEEIEDDDDDKAGRTRKLLSSKGADSDADGSSKKDDDPFLQNYDFDPDENWPD